MKVDHTTYSANAKPPLFRANLATALNMINNGSDSVFNYLDIKLNPGRVKPDYEYVTNYSHRATFYV